MSRRSPQTYEISRYLKALRRLCCVDWKRRVANGRAVSVGVNYQDNIVIFATPAA